MSISASRAGDLAAYSARPRTIGRKSGLLREILAAIIMLSGVSACVSLTYGIMQRITPAPAAPARDEPLEQPWTDIAHPLQIFALQSPEFGKDPRAYESRRHRSGGGRQDVLTYGAALGEGPSFRLALYRHGTEPAPAAAFFVDVAREAARAGLSVLRSAQPVPLQTKFGVVESSDLVLARDGIRDNCLALRFGSDSVGFSAVGLYCGGDHVPDRAALGCLIDRLDLVSAGDDAPLLRYFTSAEQSRGRTCAPLRPNGNRVTWIDPAGHTPPLRNSNTIARNMP